jgi:exonuclease VII large subunit
MRVGDGIVRSVGQVQVGDEVTVQVEDGVVRAKVV